MLSILNSLLGSKPFSEDKVKFLDLHKRGDVSHEVEVQRRIIEEKGYKVMSVLEHHNNEVLVVYRCLFDRVEEDEAMIYLGIVVISPNGIRLPEPRLDAIFDKDKKIIDIGDIEIFGTNINRGYGSVLMKALLEIAERQYVKKISGWISDVDWDHLDRLIHFYGKHGFTVEIDHEEKSGEIVLKRDN